MTRRPFELNTADDDKSLIMQIKSGDYDAFTLLYNKYIRQLTQYGFKFLPDLPAIEDCLHDVFVWIWTNRQKLSIDYSVKSYLFKSVRTSVLHLIEKQNRLSALHPEQEHEYHFALQLTPEAVVLQNENTRLIRQQVEAVLEKLTAKQKEVIYLRYYEGLHFDDIAQNMNLSVKACYKLMGRAIASLRENIPDSPLVLLLLLLGW